MKQKPVVKDASAQCGWHISYLYRKSGTFLTAELKNYGLSPMQSIVLIGVYRNQGMNQVTLAQCISTDTGVTSRVLRELEDNGYIEKRRDENNRRNLNIYLTQSGESLAEKSLEIQEAYWNSLLQGLTEEEIKSLNSTLKKMTALA